MDTNSSKKKIAFNALFLFLRSLITIVIGLFTSRILLQKLGVEDFGVYHVVGGIVLSFNALRTYFSSAIQRFLNYYRGKEEFDKLNVIFNIGFEIQLLLAIVFILLLESFGLMALRNLNLNAEQMSAARIIFQFSIATAVVSMLTVPYDALIISNEKMNVYSFLSVLESILKFVILFLISVGPFSRLVNYAILLFLVSLIIRTLNSLYCIKNFKEAKHLWVWNKHVLKEMGIFAGWNFLGNVGYSLTHEGVNYILNILGNVTLNAARGLVYQIVNALNVLISNINVAFRPQANALAAKENQKLFFELLTYNAKTSYSFYVLVMVPFIVFAKPFINIWLGVIPQYVIPFLITVSMYYYVRTIHGTVNLFFTSIGNLKYYQIIELFFLSLNLPVSYFLLKFQLPYWIVFVSMTCLEILNHISCVSLATIKYKFPIHLFLKNVYLPFTILFTISIVIIWMGYAFNIVEHNIFLLFFLILILELILISIIYKVVLNIEDRRTIVKMLKKNIPFIHK